MIDNTEDYIALMQARASGALPDMGCALRVTELLREAGVINHGERLPDVLDVGCATGHFLRTFLRQGLKLRKYVGLEIDPGMVAAARNVWAAEMQTGFVELINEDLERFTSDRQFDYVICVNAFMYFASAKTALERLIKATRRRLLVRSYFADANYRIMRAQTKLNHDKSEYGELEVFNDSGDMLCYDYWNIYSQSYIEALVAKLHRRAALEWVEDKNVLASLEQERTLSLQKRGATEIMSGQEVSYPFILPWKYLSITLPA